MKTGCCDPACVSKCHTSKNQLTALNLWTPNIFDFNPCFIRKYTWRWNCEEMVTEVDKRVNIRPVAEVVTLHLSNWWLSSQSQYTCIKASVKENPLACTSVHRIQHYWKGNMVICKELFSSVRSSYSHPNLLVITTHFFRSHRSSTLDFHFLSHYSYIKGNHWTHLLTSWIP